MRNDDVWEPVPYEPPISGRKSMAVSTADVTTFDITAILDKIDKALDSREIGLAMQKELSKSVMMDVHSGKMGSGDKVRLLGMVNDRVDGKVADTVKVEMSTSEEAVNALRELVRCGLITPDAAQNEAKLLGIKDMGVIEVEGME